MHEGCAHRECRDCGTELRYDPNIGEDGAWVSFADVMQSHMSDPAGWDRPGTYAMMMLEAEIEARAVWQMLLRD